MEGNVTTEETKNENDSLMSYASKVFQGSFVGPVSNLAQAPTPRRKVLKACFLVLCISGFMYHSGKFLDAYFQYPAVIEINILRPDNLTLPAYTFCDSNGIRRSLFCKKFPENCEEASDDFCKKYKYYCGVDKLLVPKKQYYMLKDNITQEEIIQLNANIEDFLIHNNSDHNEAVTGPYFRPKDKDISDLMLCYSWNGRVDSSLNPLEVPKQFLFRLPVNKFTFYVEEDEVFIPGERAGMLFAIHSPFEATNPFETGIFLKPGRTYMIYVATEEKVLLESPYVTDCVNYTRVWEENNRSGPRTKNMCLDKCLQEVTMLCFNCVIPYSLYPTKEKLCKEEEEVSDVECLYHSLPTDCFFDCKENCRQTTYKYNVQERFTVPFDKDGNIQKDIDRMIFVEIYLEDREVITWQHSPKYLFVEVFSTIGGFIGIWLGMSLLDITDISEGFYRIIRFSLKRR